MIREIFNVVKENYFTRNKPPSLDKRIYEALRELEQVKRVLQASISLLEISSVWYSQPQRDLQTWSFTAVYLEALKQQGWPTDYISYPANCPVHSETESMNHLLHILRIQTEGRDGRLSCAMILKDYKKPGHLCAGAVAFLYAHVDSFENVVRQLRDFKESDLQPQHKMVLAGMDRIVKYNGNAP